MNRRAFIAGVFFALIVMTFYLLFTGKNGEAVFMITLAFILLLTILGYERLG